MDQWRQRRDCRLPIVNCRFAAAFRQLEGDSLDRLQIGNRQLAIGNYDGFVLLIPVFFPLTVIFGAGFYIGRVSRRE